MLCKKRKQAYPRVFDSVATPWKILSWMRVFVVVTPPSLAVLVLVDVDDCGYICSMCHMICMLRMLFLSVAKKVCLDSFLFVLWERIVSTFFSQLHVNW